MDIRIKGAIAVFTYNLVGTLAILSAYPKDPLYNEGWFYPWAFTFPITIVSFGYRYFESDIIYPVFIIQFITLIVTLSITDLILRNYSPAYLENKKLKKERRKTEWIEYSNKTSINLPKVTIYLKYPKDVNIFKQNASTDEKLILSVEQWFTIDNLANEVRLIKKGEISQSTQKSIEKRIAQQLKDQETMDLLFTIE